MCLMPENARVPAMWLRWLSSSRCEWGQGSWGQGQTLAGAGSLCWWWSWDGARLPEHAFLLQGVDVIVNASSVEDIDAGAIGQRLSNGLARLSSPVLHRLRLREDENAEPVVSVCLGQASPAGASPAPSLPVSPHPLWMAAPRALGRSSPLTRSYLTLQGTTYQKTDAAVEMKRINREQFWEQAKVRTQAPAFRLRCSSPIPLQGIVLASVPPSNSVSHLVCYPGGRGSPPGFVAVGHDSQTQNLQQPGLGMGRRGGGRGGPQLRACTALGGGCRRRRS